MFNKPLSEVEYSDIEKFCETFEEGVRVEYKSQMIDSIPKTISAFANSLGGIILIGVETDKVTNKVIAINGIDEQVGIEERILNSSLTGIYPALIPEIKVFSIPSKESKVIIVIKVHESIDAPHAIQNSTRVYIRTGSISQPYELAEIDKIDYLLRRRDKQQKLKEQLKQNARDRFDRLLLRISESRRPCIEVNISPVFPYHPLIALDDLYVFGTKKVPYNSPHYPYFNDPQRITDGICRFHRDQNYSYYREINHYGLILTYDMLQKVPSNWHSVRDEEKEERLFLRFTQIVLDIIKTLKLAELFYKECGYIGNLEIEINIQNIANEYLMYADDSFDFLEGYKSLDNSAYSKKIITSEDTSSKLSEIVVSLTKNILWNFNPPGNIDLPRRIDDILKANKFEGYL